MLLSCPRRVEVMVLKVRIAAIIDRAPKADFLAKQLSNFCRWSSPRFGHNPMLVLQG